MLASSCRVLVATALMAVAAPIASPQARKAGSPETRLPPNITLLTGFGERAAWSPDDKRIAFMSKSFGDAFEIDLKTKVIRLLTGHFVHPGFLRVQYLPSGDLFLIGARTFTDIRTTRSRDQEMWVLKADATRRPRRSTTRSRKASPSRARPRRSPGPTPTANIPTCIAEGESVIYTADIVSKDGVPALANKKEVLRARAPECTLEAQDFRNDDTELIYTCYRSPYADVFGVHLGTGKVTTYRKLPGEYNEVEGISPDGKWTLVESSREQGGPERQNSRYIDIWKLRLEPGSCDFVRLTRWGDYEGYKASNPVVSNDGKRIAFQSARNDEPAGVGHGIFVLTLP